MKNIYKFIKYVVDNWNYPLNEDEIKLDRNKQKFFDKFKDEADTYNIDIDDDTLKRYIIDFDRIKNSPDVTIKDLGDPRVSLKQLIRWINTSSKAPNTTEKEIEQNPDVIYQSEDGNFVIYDGSKNDRCVTFGAGEKWCITRGAFSSYRYSEERGFPVFYLARNKSLPKEDKLSFVAIQVRDPQIKNESNRYVYTNRKNSPYESRTMSFEQLLDEVPWLKEIPDLKTKLRYVPLSTAEKTANKLTGRGTTYEEWLDLPYNSKEAYLTARGQNFARYSSSGVDQDLFTDMGYNEFITQELPKSENKEIAKFIAVTPNLVPFRFLLKNLSSFTDSNRKSIIANFRENLLPEEWLNDRKIPFDIKVLLFKLNKWFTKPSETIFTINNDKTIIYLTDEPRLGIYTASESYPKVKVNAKTIKTILDSPEFDPTSKNYKPLPINVVLKLLKVDGLDSSSASKLSSMITNNPSIIKVTNDEGDLLINKDDLSSFTIKDSKLTKTDIDSKTIEDLQDSNPEALEALKSSVKDILFKFIQLQYNLDRGPLYSYYNNILNSKAPIFHSTLQSLPSPITIDFGNNNKQDLISYQRSGNLAFFGVPYQKAEIPRNTISIASSPSRINIGVTNRLVSFTSDQIEKYIAYLKSNNLLFNSNALLNAIRNGELSSESIKLLIQAGLPITEEGTYKVAIIDNTLYFINKADVSVSLKVTPNGRVTRASAAVIRQFSPQTATPRTRAPRTVAAPTTAPAAGATAPAAGAATPAAGAATGGIAQAIETAGLTGFNTLPTAYKNRILGGEIIQTDRGASKRNEALGNRGRVTQIVSAGQSRFYIIRLSGETPTYIGQASFQPEAAHYIITSTRAFNMGRVGNFLASLQQNRIVTEADKIAAGLALSAASDEELKKLKNKIKPKQDMKLTELKKMIQEEITKILSEQPQIAPAKPAPGIEIAEPGTETKPERTRRIGVDDPTPSPTKAKKRKNPQPAEEIAKKISARFKNK